MADVPVFGADQIDPYSTQGGGAPVRLGQRPGVSSQNPYWYDYFNSQYSRPYQATDFQTANQDQARAEQQRVIQALQAQAAGDPNSQAQQQLGQAYQGAQSQQSSLGSTMRGQSAGAAMRGIQAGQQGIQRSLPGDQQMLMLQEQQAAQAMLAQLLAQQQGQDISQAQGMANTALGSQGIYDQMRDFYLNGMFNADVGATERGNSIARAQLGFDDGTRDLNTQLFQQAAGATAGAIGTASQFGGGRTSTHSSTPSLHSGTEGSHY